VHALKERFPDKPLVADLKITDGAYLEALMAAKAGADMVVVMGVAHPATVRATVRAVREAGIRVMGDIMAAADKVACARMLEENGCDWRLCLSTVGAQAWDARLSDRAVAGHPMLRPNLRQTLEISADLKGLYTAGGYVAPTIQSGRIV
jgi:3-keto-L-gulonate-6-phosphate decarboxylase